MSKQDILVFAEVRCELPAEIAHELLGLARGLAIANGGEVVAAVLSAHGEPYAEALRAADRIIAVDDPQLTNYAPEPYLAVLAALVAEVSPRVVLVGATSIGWDLAPLLAARIKAPLIVGCKAVAIAGPQVAVTAAFCGGKLLADVVVDAAPVVLMVQPGAARPDSARGKAQFETRQSPVPLTACGVTFGQLILPAAGDVDITQQDLLVAVGRGIQQQDNIELAESLAAALGGAVCASRPVVDQGWLPPTRQVGKSGMTVKPKVYLAFGVSGAPEHQEGMKGAETIIAVNTDPKAPLFDIAQYGAQIDALELLPSLIEAVAARRQAQAV